MLPFKYYSPNINFVGITLSNGLKTIGESVFEDNQLTFIVIESAETQVECTSFRYYNEDNSKIKVKILNSEMTYYDFLRKLSINCK